MYLDISEADPLFFSEQSPTATRQNIWHSAQYVDDLLSTLILVAD